MDQVTEREEYPGCNRMSPRAFHIWSSLVLGGVEGQDQRRENRCVGSFEARSSTVRWRRHRLVWAVGPAQDRTY